MKIGLITDIHYGPVRKFWGELRGDGTDALEKMSLLFKEMKSHGVELLINLGDNLSNESAKNDLIRLCELKNTFDYSGLPTCFVLGNHELTKLSKKDSMAVLGLDKPYYSFDAGLEKLLFLDAQDGSCPGLISARQLQWLEKQLSECESAYVFVHQSLAEPNLDGNKWFENDPAGGLIKNRKEVREILENSGKVILAVNGHLHQNRLQTINNVEYLTLNSWSEFGKDGSRSESAAIIDTAEGFYFLKEERIFEDETLSD